MGYAIKFYFSEETAQPIYTIWKSLAEASLASFLLDSGSRPGFTLAVWENACAEDLVNLLNDFACKIHTLPKIKLTGVEAFRMSPASVFLKVKPTDEVLALHRQFHAINPELTASGIAHYHVANWVPHSTLALRCPVESVAKIIEKSLEHQTVLEADIVSIGLLETGTARQVAEIKF